MIRAFNILTGDVDGSKEKGFCPALYEGLKYCSVNEKATSNGTVDSANLSKHIHVLNDRDYLANLISKGMKIINKWFLFLLLLAHSKQKKK